MSYPDQGTGIVRNTGSILAANQASQCAPPARPASLDDRLETLGHFCRRLGDIERRLRITVNGVRCIASPKEDQRASPEPIDLLGKFGHALDFAGDRLMQIEDLAQQLDAALFNHEARQECAR